jgi:hypothetical protein
MLWRALHEPTSGSLVLPRERIKPTLIGDGEFHRTTTLPANEALLVSKDGPTFDCVIAGDASKQPRFEFLRVRTGRFRKGGALPVPHPRTLPLLGCGKVRPSSVSWLRRGFLCQAEVTAGVVRDGDKLLTVGMVGDEVADVHRSLGRSRGFSIPETEVARRFFGPAYKKGGCALPARTWARRHR